jgi:serine/threonine protein kinase
MTDMKNMGSVMATTYLCSLCSQKSTTLGFCPRDGVLLVPNIGALSVGGYQLSRLIRREQRDTPQGWLVQRSPEEAPAILQIFSGSFELLQRAKHLRGKVIHAAFPTILEAGTFEGRPYIIYEKVEGTPLSETMAPRRSYSPGEAARLMVHLLNALDSLHRFTLIPEAPNNAQPYRAAENTERDLWHGRFFLSNIALTPGGELRFLNLGYVLRSLPKETPASTEELCAVALEESQPRPSVDVYLAGCVLYELLTGKKHNGFDAALRLTPELLNSPTIITPQPPFDLSATPAWVDYSGVPPEMKAIIERATQISAERRYQSASQMMSDLLVFLGADASFSSMYLDDAVHFVRERAAQSDLLSIAQLLAARPDLCVPSWFTRQLWVLLGDHLTERLLRLHRVDSIDWALWTNIPEAREALLSILTRAHPSGRFDSPSQVDAVKVIAAQLLGYHRDVSSALVESLNSRYPELREAAAHSLAKVRAAPPVTHGGNQIKIVPCSQRWDAMTQMSADDSSRMCQKCQTPVVKVSSLEDLKKIAGKGCAVYNPNAREGAAKRAIKDLYSIRVSSPLAPPPTLLSPEERPEPEPPPRPMTMGIALPGIDLSPTPGLVAEPPDREGLLRRIARFFRRE